MTMTNEVPEMEDAAVAEEIWFRFGLMTLLVWLVTKLAGDRGSPSIIAWAAILVTAVGFGLAHLPQLLAYGAGSPFAIGATLVGNTVVATLFGWLYWKRGLAAAIVAHFAVDLVLHVVSVFVP